jgi:polyferredoxin
MTDASVAQEIGTKATVTVEATAEGEMLICLDFHGQAMGKKTTVVQCLALKAVEVMRATMRESFDVTGEEILHRPGGDILID